MFLALHDARKNLDSLTQHVLDLAERFRPRSENTALAREAWTEDLAEEASARPHYMVWHYATRAFDEPVAPLPPPGGGEVLVCTVIRRIFPLAPTRFKKKGKLDGSPGVPSESARCRPNKTELRQFGREVERGPTSNYAILGGGEG
jgi:hypothetical protein